MESSEVKRFPASGGGPVRAKLIERLKDGKPDDIVTDAELAACCGLPTGTGHKGYPALLKAIRYTYRNHGVVWERIRDADAIQCLNPDGIIVASDRTSTHIRRESAKAVQKLKTVAMEAVEESKRPAFLSRLAQHGTLAMFAKRTTQTKLQAAGKSIMASPKKLLELFR